MGINIKISSVAIIEMNSISLLKAGTVIDINFLDGILGHASEAVVGKTAKQYCWKLLGNFKNVKIVQSPRLNVITYQRTMVLKVLYLVNVYALT